MTNEQKAQRVLAACGRSAGEIAHYPKHIETLAKFCDDDGVVKIGAREAWRQAYREVLEENKGTSEETDD